MKRLITTLCLTIAVLLGSVGVSASADFEKGAHAYARGDYATALREWTPLAEQGYASAQYNLGQMYRKGQGVPKNDKTAVKWYKLAAEQGQQSAQNNLGVMYDEGRGVPQNYKTALKWYRLAAEQGNANAPNNLGLMYAQGTGVIQSYIYAHMWGNIAASNGDEDGVKLQVVVAKEMTPTQLEKAQNLARECIRKHYKGC